MVEKRKEQKIVNISYMQYDSLMKKLVSKVNSHLHKKRINQYDGFFGLRRGGYPIAVHLSHHCGLPVLYRPTKKTIIVDDISDSGNTLQKYKDKKLFIVTLFCKTKTKVVPNIYIKMVKEEDWVVHPWEMLE